MLTKQQKIDILQSQIDQIKDIKTERDFKKWRNDTESVIENIFGKNTRQTNKFEYAFFTWDMSVYTSKVSDFPKEILEETDAYPVLESFVNELRIFGESTGSSTQQRQERNERDQVFISYSHKDDTWLERVQIHLKPLEREGIIKIWDDTRIDSGDEWYEAIQKALNSTKVAVLLVTANFIASDFIVNEELPPLLDAAEAGGAKILPLVISASRFEQIPSLAKFQAVNSPSLPLDQMEKQEEILVKLTNDIDRIFQQKETKFITVPLSSTGLVNNDLSIYTQPPFGKQKFNDVLFHIENTRISMADVYDGNSKIINLQKPILGGHAIHFLINAGDGRQRYGEIVIGHIELIFDNDILPSQKVEIVLGRNIREWAIGNYVTVKNGRTEEYDPLVVSVKDQNTSCLAWEGRTSTGQPAVIDMLTVKIDASKKDKELVAIRFTRDIPLGKSPLDYFISSITIELE